MGWDRGIFHDSSDSSRFTCCRKYFFEWSLSGILSGILSDKYSSIPSGIYPHVLSKILFGMCSCPCNRRAACRSLWDWSNLETFIWQVGKPLRLILTMAFSRTKFLTFYLTYILFWHFIWHSIWHINIYIHSDPLSAGANFEWFRMPVCRWKKYRCRTFLLKSMSMDWSKGSFAGPPLLYIYQIYHIYIYIYIYIWWENQWFPVKIFQKKKQSIDHVRSAIQHRCQHLGQARSDPTLQNLRLSEPSERCFVELVELRIRGIRPRITVSFLLISKHIMLDQCWIILSFVHWFIIRLALKVNIICFKIVSRLCAPWYWKKYIVNCCSIIRKKMGKCVTHILFNTHITGIHRNLALDVRDTQCVSQNKMFLG